MTSLAVALDPQVPDRFRDAIAAMPQTFVPSASGTAQIRLLDGTPGWPLRAANAIRGGAQAVLVADPAAESVTDLLAITDAAGVPVVVAPRGGHDPLLPTLHERMAATDGALLELRLTLRPEQRAEAWPILTGIVRRADSAIVEVLARASNAHGMHATMALASGRHAVIALDLTRGANETGRLRLVGSRGMVDATIPLAGRMRPGVLTVSDEKEETTAPPDFTTDAVAAMRAVAAAAVGAPDVSLSQFGSDAWVAALDASAHGRALRDRTEEPA